MATAIEDAEHHDLVGHDPIVNGIRKALCQQSVKSEMVKVNASVQHQRINLRNQAVEEILTDAFY
jgi:hypothetical protein